MPTWESALQRGARRATDLLRRIGAELRIARIAAGLSTRNIASSVGISHTHVRRIEAGLAPHVDLDVLARMASLVGHELSLGVPDRRSADAVASTPVFDAVIEAETRVHDVQATQRRLRSKQRDLNAQRAILLLADTRHNRAVIAAVPDIREQFPIQTRACIAALARGEDPGGDCLVIL